MKKLIRKIDERLTSMKFVMDQKGGPGLEEAILIFFIVVVVAKNLNAIGTLFGQIFTTVISALKTAIGIA